MINAIKNAADKIIHAYIMGKYTREEAHNKLNELNKIAFGMYDFDVAAFDPDVTQTYIHDLQERYTIEIC